MTTRGTPTSTRLRSARIPSGVVPRSRARSEASWMVGPSIIGSEKGIPTSMASAPAPASASTVSNQWSSMPPVT